MSASRSPNGAAARGAEELRTGRLVARLRELELDGLLVNPLADVRYLTGFTGSSGLALILAPSDAGGLAGPRFFTDFRYATQSAEQVPPAYTREIVSGGDLLDAVAATLAGAGAGGRLGFDEGTLSVRSHRRLGEGGGEGWELVPTTGEVARLRAVKDGGELARIRAAAELADEALRAILEEGLAGRTERDVAIDLELRMRRLGAESPSFETIVASGAHSALPHAEPRAVEIPRGVLVTIDWGALLDGYCSDCTRTFASGEDVSEREREIYGIVLEAQRAGLEAVRPGITGREADAAARGVIEGAGLGKLFGHGLGHGVGLEVHEPPRLARKEAAEPLQAGNAVTVEPGVYVPGEFGVRIEDLVAVTDDGNEVFSTLPKELTII
jgi:Xaa-Pro aminopeptidase